MPSRIQLRRTKGWRLPEGAISVARPTRWGNPFTIAGAVSVGWVFIDTQDGRAFVVARFKDWLTKGERSGWWYSDGAHTHAYMRSHLDDLRGLDLACWCPLDGSPCHADVLLEISNS